MYVQIVGQLRPALSPPEPEWAHVALYVTARGLTTGPIPSGDRTFEVEFDFLTHALHVTVSEGPVRGIALGPRSVAEFYEDVIGVLRALDIEARISTMPSEVPNPIRFTDDTEHASYDRDWVARFWRILVHADTALREHRAPFRRRPTPVQFFWGGFDLAYPRYSGRPATPPRDDVITRFGMDAEEICAGFWPGDDRLPEPAFWCYGYPKPAGIERASIGPPAAFWSDETGLFVLPYETVRTSDRPRALLREFFTTTYDACASLAHW